jgi:tetratricopeptide (TPR) repeat protein
MREPHAQQLYDRAWLCWQQGNSDLAIEQLQELLGTDPEDADGHALLSLCLLEKRRLAAAEAEAKIAASIDPDTEQVMSALVYVALAARKLDDAERAIDRLLERDPNEAVYLRARAELCDMRADDAGRLAALESALAADADDASTLAALADYWLDKNELQRAETYARDCLEQDPQHTDGLVAMGRVLLRHGDVDAARDHSRWALRSDPEDTGALSLMCEIKARHSPVLGAWWRYSVWIGALGEVRSILVLLSAYVIQRALVILCDTGGQEDIADTLRALWSFFAAYTWFGPGLFERAVKKELEQVQLDDDF